MKYVVLLCLVVLTVSTSANKKMFDLRGSVSGKDGKVVHLVRYTEGPIQQLASDTIRNGKFHISCIVDEITPAVVQMEGSGCTVILEKARVYFTLHPDGSYNVKGGKYNPVLLGFLKNKDFMDSDASFRKLTNGGNIELVKGTKKEWDMIQVFLRKEEMRSLYLDNLVKTHTDPVVKGIAAIMCELQPDAKKTTEIIEGVADKFGENSLVLRRIRAMGQQQAEALERRHKGMLGENFADFTAATLDGAPVQLASIVKEHRYTLLQFWASWCGPCRKEIPLLKQLYTKYHSGGLEIVSFSMDDNKYNWEKASEAEQFNWYNISDLQAFKSGVARSYPIMGIPSNVIIDREGKIVASNLTGDDLEKKIDALMQ